MHNKIRLYRNNYDWPGFQDSIRCKDKTSHQSHLANPLVANELITFHLQMIHLNHHQTKYYLRHHLQTEKYVISVNTDHEYRSNLWFKFSSYFFIINILREVFVELKHINYKRFLPKKCSRNVVKTLFLCFNLTESGVSISILSLPSYETSEQKSIPSLPHIR